MTLDWIPSLDPLSIVNDIAENLDFTHLIRDFGEKKANVY